MIFNSHPLMKRYFQQAVSGEETVIPFEAVTTHRQDFHISVDGPSPLYLFTALTEVSWLSKEKEVGKEDEGGMGEI